MKLELLILCVGISVTAAGCSSSPEGMPEPDAATGADAAPPPPDAAPVPPSPNRADRLPLDTDGCPGIYAQQLVPSFHLDIEPDVLAEILAEWQAALEMEPRPEYPVAKFRWEDVEITNATVRLRGNNDYWFDDGKMQLQVSFNATDEKGRFLGLRKLVFDAASANKSFLRDRLSYAVLRAAGLKAPCANNARLYINGEYYGLVTSIERADKEFLERVFEDPEGDLWKRGGWELRTNETTSNDTRLRALRRAAGDITGSVGSPAELAMYLDIPQAIRLWATDAILSNSDGPWAGGYNYMLYDDPLTGKFIHIPWDYDNGFTRLDYRVDPYRWRKPDDRFRGRPFYAMTVENPDDRSFFPQYVAELEDVLNNAYVVEVMQQWIMEWSEQIRPFVAEDPNLPDGYVYPNDFDRRVDQEIEYVANRHACVMQFVSCWQTNDFNADSCIDVCGVPDPY